uniref:UDENN domain-containing protein n=1 Tax=Cyprinodon variegatus TaxID=28743 RepID=A0A3Q2G065_CYPVA
ISSSYYPLLIRPKDNVAVQHFTFVLTDLEGCQRFGFCRLTNGTQTCLCILSYLPWFEVFYKLLNNLADYLSKGQINEIKALLAVLHKQSIPLAPGSVTLQMGEQLLVSTDVSCPVGHTEGQEGVSSTGVHVAQRIQAGLHRLTPSCWEKAVCLLDDLSCVN